MNTYALTMSLRIMRAAIIGALVFTGLWASLPTVASAQVPGTTSIIKEFPDFTKEIEEELSDMMDFEYSRAISVSGYGNYDILLGGLSATQGNHFGFSVSIDYFMFTQTAFIMRFGLAEASLRVAGYQTYTDTTGRVRKDERLVYTGVSKMWPITAGLRYYLGHPAYPTIFSFLGLHGELTGGVLIRSERYSILEAGPNHPGLKHYSDISPIFRLMAGIEIAIVPRTIFLGARGGYIMALLADRSMRGYVGEPRNGSWITMDAYFMVHLD